MKILHVITSLRTGGAEKLLVDLLPRFKAMGHDVELLLFDGTITPFYKSILQSGIKIHSLSIGQSPYNLLNILRLRKYLRNYDIIHTHNTACQYFVPIANIIFNAKCTLITTEHSTFNRRRKHAIFKYIDRFIYHQYSTIISISKKTTENLVTFNGNDFRIITIENGIDLSKFNKLAPSSITQHEKVITMVAGFRVPKDQDTLIKAISLLPSNYKLWLVGDGERKQILKNLANKLNLNNRITFYGIRNDIPQILEHSQIIVLSSHWEGLSLSCIEGMASGRPFIASDVNGLKEVVNGYGILFPHQDYHSLAENIKSLCENSNKYTLVSRSCRERAQQYDINIMANKYLNLYNEFIS